MEREEHSVTRHQTPVSSSLWYGNIAVSKRVNPYAIAVHIPDDASLVRMLWPVNGSLATETGPLFGNFTGRRITGFNNLYFVKAIGYFDQVNSSACFSVPVLRLNLRLHTIL